MLKNDPVLRYSEAGRRLIRWIEAHILDPDGWSPAISHVPPHSAYLLAELATGCAAAWTQLATELRERTEEEC